MSRTIGERRPLRVQLWSYNYDPEPTGIGPVSRTWAHALRDRGVEIDVVAAHPHYPEPRWGKRLAPYRERRDGIPVLRLPLWIGRASAMERYRQELSFMAAQFAALPALGRPDVVVSVSPSFPALLPGLVNARVRRLPWVIWLHDILPDGAAVTGLVDEGAVLKASRRLELAAYAGADRIVVLSEAFIRNLRAKGVAEGKLELIYDPATREPKAEEPARRDGEPLRLLSMGNIGHSQGLAAVVEAFEADPSVAGDIELVITGNGVAADDVRAVITSGRVDMPGVVSDERLEHELQSADVAVVTQHYEGGEFNIPSKLMNFMAYGLPVLAAVNPQGEVARIVRESGAGWVVDSSRPETFPAKIAELREDRDQVARLGTAARAYAKRHFTVDRFGERFDDLLREVAAGQATAEAAATWS